MLPVLIVGAGPTGLVLALWLTKRGIPVRIIDQAEVPGTTSRALVVHARTLEFYRQLGISESVVEKGFRFPRINLWVDQSPKARFDFEKMGSGLTPFPYLIIFPQDQHEKFLINKLKEMGVEVERKTELLSLTQTESSVKSRVRTPRGEMILESQFVAGCDGARSVVRHQIGAEFEGSTYPDWFYVADVQGSGPILNGELHLSLDEAEFLAVFPMKEKGTARFIGVIRTEDDGSKLRWEDVNPRVFRDLNAQVEKVNWFSTYHVHHRVAKTFQKGRVFLLGDAGHIHSPIGGQGMNTGIGDAVNLAWKLGEVISGKTSVDLLATYEIERVAFAQRLVRTTDQMFKLVSAAGPIAGLMRTKVAPFLVPKIFHYFRHFLFRTVSQTAINYRHCSLNQGSAGKLKGGDRLPWIESVDNFAPLKSMEWQIHIYGEKKLEGFAPVRFPWKEEMRKKGLVKDAAYVIRPDGYIGLISENANATEIANYLRSL